MGLSFTGSFIIIKPNCAVNFFFLLLYSVGGGGNRTEEFLIFPRRSITS